MTTLQHALVEVLRDRQQAVLPEHELFLLVAQLYKSKSYAGEDISLKKHLPERRDFLRTANRLRATHVLSSDADFYKDAIYRVVIVPDEPADHIACEVDPLVYISHLSAMQRYGLTNRNPSELIITRPKGSLWYSMTWCRAKRMFGELDNIEEHIRIKRFVFPEMIRQRRVQVHETNHPGETRHSRNTPVRIASIGQTFADMITRPQWCGGMAHVLSVWSAHAATYLEEIIAAVDRSPTKLVKVRGGYILDERLQLRDERIWNWLEHAQRGGSRVLDPTQPYKSVYSEKWMISINAEER